MAAGPNVIHKYSPYMKDGTVKEIVDDARIKHADFFNFKYLYRICHDWFVDHNWASASDPKWPETYYAHRWTQKNGEEVWIWWRFRKQYNEFFRADFDCDWHMIGVKPAETVRNGKKFKGEKGTAEFKIYVRLIFDPDQKFKGGILGALRETFWQRIMYKDFLTIRKQTYHEIFEFKQALKTYFRLPQYLAETQLNNYWRDDTNQTQFYDEDGGGGHH